VVQSVPVSVPVALNGRRKVTTRKAAITTRSDAAMKGGGQVKVMDTGPSWLPSSPTASRPGPAVVGGWFTTVCLQVSQAGKWSVAMEACLQLRPDVGQVSVARHFVADALARWDGLQDPELTVHLTGELVANAILHARTNVTVVVRFEPPVLRVEVHDESADVPRMATPDPRSLSGRGLRLVESLADQWGVQMKDEGGKVVWFDITPEPKPSRRAVREPPPFGIRVLDEDADPVVVVVDGELDVAVAPQVEAFLRAVVEGGTRHLVLDVAGVSLLGSRGVGALVRAWRPLSEAGGTLTIRNPTPLVRHVLTLDGMDEVWPIEADE
jgi:anti-anti-sigma factor